MQVSNIPRNVLAAMAATLLPLGASHAGSISTPIIGSLGTQLVCSANNVSAASVKVTVNIIGIITNESLTCLLPKGDRRGCVAIKNIDFGHCVISIAGAPNSEVASAVRGVLISRKQVSPFSIEATVQAQ